MNSSHILLYKPAGFTPLQTLNQLRAQYPRYENETLSYAGRLDPMAEGILLVLVGAENKQRHTYLDLEKTYEFEILLGVSTDTYDGMGMITDTQSISEQQIHSVVEKLRGMTGSITLPYPPYSSKTVNGKPLHWYAKNNLLSTIQIPEKQIVISHMGVEQSQQYSVQEIHASLTHRIQTVDGAFRQEEILAGWTRYVHQKESSKMHVLRCTTTVTSGTYIRGIVHHVSIAVQIPMLAYTIKRTAIGPFTLNQVDIELTTPGLRV